MIKTTPQLLLSNKTIPHQIWVRLLEVAKLAIETKLIPLCLMISAQLREVTLHNLTQSESLKVLKTDIPILINLIVLES